jgi:hypothetical protein
MARSIHSTKKQRLRELKYSQNSGFPISESMTDLEREGLTKDIYKLNAQRKKQADKQDAPIHVHLKLEERTSASFTRSARERRQKKV